MTQTWEWEGWLRLSLPYDWTVEVDDGVVSLYQAETGCGAITISTHVYGTPAANVQERAVRVLTDFAKNENGRIEVLRAWRPQTPDQAVAAYAWFVAESGCWETWFVSDDQRRLLLSYNCDIKDRGVERNQYGTILQSAEFLWMGGAQLLRWPWYWTDPDEAVHTSKAP